MPMYSNGRIGTYENCPQQYKLSYIDKIKLPEEQDGISNITGDKYVLNIKETGGLRFPGAGEEG